MADKVGGDALVAGDMPKSDDIGVPKQVRARIKGARTRRRIMNATLRLLSEQSYADVRITEIARVAEITQPNFYTYFASIEDVVAAIATDITADPLTAYIDPDWTGPAGIVLAKQLVEEGIKLWQVNRAVFTIVSFLADKQHGNFPALRVRQMRSVYKAFEAKVREAQAAGRISPAVQPRLAGYQSFAVLASAGTNYALLTSSGFTHDHLVETTARQLRMLTTGIAH